MIVLFLDSRDELTLQLEAVQSVTQQVTFNMIDFPNIKF